MTIGRTIFSEQVFLLWMIRTLEKAMRMEPVGRSGYQYFRTKQSNEQSRLGMLPQCFFNSCVHAG